MKRNLFWFRNDLRLTDNPAFQAALAQSDEVIPVFILDERLLRRDRWGFRRLGPYRLPFLLESLQDLEAHLRELGSGLVLSIGLPEREIPRLVTAWGCGAVFASKEYTHEELAAERAMAACLDTHWEHGATLYHPGDLPFAIGDLPDVFTVFRKRVEQYGEVRDSFPAPVSIESPELPPVEWPTPEALGYALPPVDNRGVMHFRGGARAAYARLDHYLWDTEALSTYKETRNGLLGSDYSSKFSPWLANGCISPRAIYQEVNRYEEEIVANDSTYWLKFELLWRDYFKFVAMKYGRRIFFPGGIQDKAVRWKHNPSAFRRWTSGTTGDNFVDANMRELLYTGWMSNRGRQNVASYLVHQLREDWRRGAAWFESMLVDYDVTSNYGNWMYAAGVGNDPRDRVFNTRKQADQYDRDGQYRDHWLDNGGEEPLAFIRQFG